jgi:RNA polymerase sigma factor (sigma-70 family)
LNNCDQKLFLDILNDNIKEINTISKMFFRRNKYIGLTSSDYFQESCLAIVDALNNYDKNRGNFKNYLFTIIYNRLNNLTIMNHSILSIKPNAARTSLKIKKLLQQNKNLEEIIHELKITKKQFYNIYNILHKEDFLDYKIYNIDNYWYIHDDLEEILTKDEFMIFKMCMNDMNISQISRSLDKPIQSTRNIVKRIFSKVQHYINIPN